MNEASILFAIAFPHTSLDTRHAHFDFTFFYSSSVHTYLSKFLSLDFKTPQDEIFARMPRLNAPPLASLLSRMNSPSLATGGSH